MSLSVILITKNAEKTLEACLSAVESIANEIIILDSGSEDNTLEIAKQFTSHVISTDWPGFGIQKQRALDRATGDWVLSIDADEVLSDALQQEVLSAIKRNNYDAYYLRFIMVFAGNKIKGFNEYRMRLFKREKSHFSDDQVHERLITSGKIGRLRQPLYHYSYQSIDHWIDKMNLYTTLSIQSKKKSSVSKAVISSILTFFKFYFLKGGIFGGRMGFVISLNWAMGNYYKYLKLALNKDFKFPSENRISGSEG